MALVCKDVRNKFMENMVGNKDLIARIVLNEGEPVTSQLIKHWKHFRFTEQSHGVCETTLLHFHNKI